MVIKRYRLISMVLLILALYAKIPCVEALADGFSSMRVRFDGKQRKGKLDHDNYLRFSAWSKWGAPIIVRFSPIVRSQFNLVPFIETEADGVLGSHTVTFNLYAKVRGVTYRNLRVQVLDAEDNVIPSDGVVSQAGKGWIIGLATEKKPHYINFSYSSEKKLELTPADSQGNSEI